MSNSQEVTFSHFGICTADLDRSYRFYTEALGFTHKRSIDELGEPLDTLMELPGAKLHIHQVACGPILVELIAYSDVETVGNAERRPMNKRGFTHFTLGVDDVEPVLARIEKFGGKVHNRVDSPFGPLVFCTDPDGVRIEVMNKMEG